MTSETMALYAARVAYDKKAENIDILHVSDMTIISDYMVICSGDNYLHVRAICDELCEKMKETDITRCRIEGYEAGRWIVCDFGDVLVHIFHKEEREFYSLERLWSDGTNSRRFDG